MCSNQLVYHNANSERTAPSESSKVDGRERMAELTAPPLSAAVLVATVVILVLATG